MYEKPSSPRMRGKQQQKIDNCKNVHIDLLYQTMFVYIISLHNYRDGMLKRPLARNEQRRRKVMTRTVVAGKAEKERKARKGRRERKGRRKRNRHLFIFHVSTPPSIFVIF